MLWNIEAEGLLLDLTDAEQIQIMKIEELYAENNAMKVDDSHYLIPHTTTIKLSIDERELLDLPEIFPYRLRISAFGALTDRSFRYKLEYMQPNGIPFINPQVTGSVISITNDIAYTFNEGQYYIVQRVAECNARLASGEDIEDLTRYNFLNFAELKDVATAIDAEMDGYLRQNKVVVPKKLSIIPRFQKNGDVVIDPVVMGDKGEEIPYNEDFQKVFESRQDVKTVYRGSEGFYVIKPEVEEALKEIKAKRRIAKKNVQEFLKHPESVFFSPIFDFNISDYSDRVIDIGEYKYKTESNGPSGIAWLPPEGTAYTENEQNNGLNITVENVKEIAKLVKEAQENNCSYIIYEDETYVITAKMIAEIERLLEIINFEHGDIYKGHPSGVGNNDTGDEGQNTETQNGKNGSSSNNSQNGSGIESDEKKKKIGKKILLIDPNFGNVTYTANPEESEVIDIKNVQACLNDDINLLNHQKKGLEWLLNCYAEHKGALLADDMGLGKTLQTLAFIAVVRKCIKYKTDDSVLIVAPVSLLTNWQEEYAKFLKEDTFENVVILDSESIKYYRMGDKCDLSPLAKNCLVLTSYETLRLYQFGFGKIDWSIMVLDEAQRIKNPTALITIAIKAMKYKFGLCLTGTPVENTWVDLWSIMDFASPGGKLGSLSYFKNEYVNKLKRNGNDREKIKELGQKLHDSLDPLFMRRLKRTLSKQGVLPELPQKKIECKWEIMPLPQKLAYENILNDALEKEFNKASALEVVAKLRDISLYPDIGTIDERSITSEDVNKIFNSSARLKVTFSELVNIYYKGEKVLIFIESKKMQRILRVVVEKFFHTKVPIPINGDMRGELRQNIVDEFNNKDGFGVLILSPLAAGVGLNIASANHVIHLSRHWNPAKEDQATDRAYRIGQKKDVEVVIPMAIHPVLLNDTFDCKLNELLEYKRQLSEDALFPTADGPEDGLGIFDGVTSSFGGIPVEKEYYDISGVDNVDGLIFERIIERLYNVAGMSAVKTSDSNDNGADVIVFSGSKKPNLLIQCKKTRNVDNNMGKEGIQEITGALAYYESMHSCKFTPVVITNAKGFTSGACMLAKANRVDLISREQLINMLKIYPVEKIYI